MDHPNQGGDQDEQFPGLLAQDDEIFFEDFVSQLLADDVPDPVWDVAGTIQHGAPTALGAPEFAYDENQTLSSDDKELNEQQCDRLIADTFGLLLPPMMLLGPPDTSYPTDQSRPLPASGMQLPENQMPAGIQPLIQEQLDPAAERERNRLVKKRAADQAYRKRKKQKEQELIDENQGLVRANQEKDQLLNAFTARMEDKLLEQLEKITKAEAEIEHLKKQHLLLGEKYLLLEEKLEKTSRENNQLHQKMENYALRNQRRN